MRPVRLLALAVPALLLATAAPRRAAATGVVVALAPPRAGSAARAPARLAGRLESLGLVVRATLAGGVADGSAAALAAARALPPSTPFAGLDGFDPARVWLLEAGDAAGAAAALDSLRRDPDVAWAELEVERAPAVRALDVFPGGPPDDPLFRDGRQWALRNLGPDGPLGGVAGADIGALEAWSLSAGSNDLRLAVADTGLDPAHPEFAGLLPDGSPRLVDGRNTSGLELASAWADSFYHGTAVTGVMAARTGDGTHLDSLGIAGVCGGDGGDNAGCRIVPIKITARHSGSATSFAIAAAAVYAVDAGARAMNLSFAGDMPSRVERVAMHWALVHGCVVVCGSGNHGYLPGGGVQYPAAFAADGLGIQVGASDQWDQRASWSSYGPDMDLVAPGVDIWTTFMTYPNALGASYPGYVMTAGTSFAAPHVTGTVGLLAAVRPELGDVDFRHLLRESAHDIGAPGVDAETGWGRLDAAAALRLVGPAVGIWHDEVAAQSFRSRGYDTLAVGEGGFGTLAHWVGRHEAERVEVTATVTLPDSFLGPVRAWPRLAGTTTARGTWTLPYYVPWAEVVEWSGPGTGLPAGARAFTLRGDLYRVTAACDDCDDEAWVPLGPDAARFAFTVIGRVDRPPAVSVAARPLAGPLAPGDTLSVRWESSDPDTVSAVDLAFVTPGREPLPLARAAAAAGAATIAVPCGAWAGAGAVRVTARDERGPRRDAAWAEVPVSVAAAPCNGGPAAALAAAPNPFGALLRISGPARAALTIVDVTGRTRRHAALDGGGAFAWDGRDDEGRALPAGLYFVRAAGVARVTRLVRVR